MSTGVPSNTLWYNGDWDLFSGITGVTGVNCPCGETGAAQTCVSRPVNEVDVTLLMGIFTDFMVTDATGWRLDGLFSRNFTPISQSDLSTLMASWEIRQGVSQYNGGTLIASGISPMTVSPTGQSVLVGDPTLYSEYTFLVTGLNIALMPGLYWMNVAPILTQTIIDTYGSDFLIFNSTTMGANAIGTPPGNDANDYLAVGFPDPGNNFIETIGFGYEYHDFSNGVTGIVIPVCIDPDMMALLADASKKKIRDLVPGDLLQTANPNAYAKVAINYRNKEPHRVMIKMNPGSLGPGVPDDTFFITTNHKVLINGVLTKPRDLVNGVSINRVRRPKPINTHTIVTEDGEPVLINGVEVATWSVKDWIARQKLPPREFAA